MESNLIKTLRPIVYLSRVLGISSFSCRLNLADSTMYSSSSTWYTFCNTLQMMFYLTCTYMTLRLPPISYRYESLIRFWAIIATTRFTEEWIIKLTNGVVEFDRKFRALPPRPEVRVRTPSGCFWWTFAAVYSVYYVCVVTYMVRKHDMGYLLERVFAVPRIVDFAITVTVCFYLGHLGLRFAGLNAFWKRHMSSGLLRDQRSRSMSLLRNPRHQSIGLLRNPGHQSIGLLRNPGYRSAREVAVLVECTRLLHADLSDLLRVFNRAYGPVLVVFFAFVVFDMTFNYFVLLFAKQIHLDVWPAILLNAQAVMFVVSVLGLATWVSEQKKKIILLLRSNQIAGLSKDIQIQIQFFMDQISTYEMNETLACGMFDYRLRFLIPIVVVLIKITSTMIQMDDQSDLKHLINDIIYNGPWNG